MRERRPDNQTAHQRKAKGWKIALVAILTVAMVMQSSNVQAIAEEVLSNAAETPAAITETSADVEAQQEESTDESATEAQAETEEAPAEEQAEAETPAVEEQEPAAEEPEQTEVVTEDATAADQQPAEVAEPVDTTATLTFDVAGATLSYDNKSVTADTVEKTAEVSNTLDFKFTVSADEGRQVDSVKAVTSDGAESDITADANETYTLAAGQLDGATIKVTTSEVPAEPVEEAPAEEEPTATEDPANSDEGATVEEEATETGEAAPAESEETDNGDENVTTDAPTVLEAEKVVADVSSPAFEGYAYVGDVVVKVTAAEGILPEGTTVSAELVDRDSILQALTNAVEQDGEVVNGITAVDITLNNANGDEVQPDGPVNVCLFSEDGVGEGGISVYRVADDASTVQPIVTRQNDSEVQSFDVEHFSIYAAVASSGTPSNVLRSALSLKMGDTTEVECTDSGRWHSHNFWSSDDSVATVTNTKTWWNSTVKDKQTVTAVSPGVATIYCGSTPLLTVNVTSSTINVTFDPNGGTGGSFTLQTSDWSSEKSSYVLSLPNPDERGITREGYTFVGWSTTQNGTGDNYTPQQIAVKDGQTYYAIWAKNDANESLEAEFFLRLDGDMPYEPNALIGEGG